jgi:hypothetical protein
MNNGDLSGPYLAAAVLCEKVLEDKDGVLSAIRMVDRFVITAQGVGAPQNMPPVPVNLSALIVFKSGDAKGSYSVKIRPVAPSGRFAPEISLPIFLEGDERGANLLVNLGFQAVEEGLYWFDILLNEELVTRMPLRLLYQRIAQGSGGTPIH